MAEKRITYKVTLTQEERQELMSIINKGTHTSQRLFGFL